MNERVLFFYIFDVDFCAGDKTRDVRHTLSDIYIVLRLNLCFTGGIMNIIKHNLEDLETRDLKCAGERNEWCVNNGLACERRSCMEYGW